MNNKGQTTVFFSLIMSALLLFTFTALEVTRIHMSRVKMMACVHSMRSSLMADYNHELFERYHLFFLDPAYGTDSEAVAEERLESYLEDSLNGEEDDGIYQFRVEEIALTKEVEILYNDMELVKKQIVEYEKEAGIPSHAEELWNTVNSYQQDINAACDETEMNAVELPEGEKESEEEGKEGGDLQEEVEDPRQVLLQAMEGGFLAYLMPDCDLSKEKRDFSKAPSAQYETRKKETQQMDFWNITAWKTFLRNSSEKEATGELMERACLLDYLDKHFSNVVHPAQDSILKGELEYILEGACSDYENAEAVVTDIIFLRVPVNYAYLLTDMEKKSEALSVATAICTAAGTPSLAPVVKYLLLGCWAYGESIHEMQDLLAGKKIPLQKTKMEWRTELTNLVGGKEVAEPTSGLTYEDYLLLLLAAKTEKKWNGCLSRMLDVVELNLQQEDADFCLEGLVGELTIQGKIVVQPFYQMGQEIEQYSYYFEENIAY